MHTSYSDRDKLRQAMGTLPSDSREINWKHKPEIQECSAFLVDTNRNPFRSIFSTATATWGDNVYKDKWLETPPADKLKVIVAALTGRTLPQALENVNFTFRIRGVPRSTFNHHTEIAKLGCTFYSVGCRDNNKLDTDFIIADGITISSNEENLLSEYFEKAKKMYAKMLDSEGGSWQSARAFLPLAYQHSYHFTQNLLSFLRMYPTMQNDIQLKIVYERMLDAIKGEGYNLFEYAITSNKELKKYTESDIDKAYYFLLTDKERELLN